MVDLHMHTTYSDGKNSIEDMVLAAIDIGLKKIAITDHIWKSSEWFDEYCKEISNLKKKNKKIQILIGFEAKALSTNGNIDATEHMCNKANIKLGAIHRIPRCKEDSIYFSREEIKINKKLAYQNWFITTINMIKNRNVDIIAHPLMVLKKYNLQINKNDLHIIFKEAYKNNTRLEISKRYKHSNKELLEFVEKYPLFLNSLSFGSDSHSIKDLKYD